MNEQEEQLLRLAHEQNVKRQNEQKYEADCKRVTGGFLSAVDIVKLYHDVGNDWPEAPGAEARRLIREKNLPFLEVGPGRFAVGHVFAIPEEAA